MRGMVAFGASQEPGLVSSPGDPKVRNARKPPSFDCGSGLVVEPGQTIIDTRNYLVAKHSLKS